MMFAPVSSTRCGDRALTAPAVPTGMNTGVSISPWAVRDRPARALDPDEVASREKKGRAEAPNGRPVGELRSGAGKGDMRRGKVGIGGYNRVAHSFNGL